jgi:hypothetical protein
VVALRFLKVTQDGKDTFWKWSGSDMLVAISLLWQFPYSLQLIGR